MKNFTDSMRRTRNQVRLIRYLFLTVVLVGVGVMMAVNSCRRGEYRISEGVMWHTTYRVVYDADRDLGDSIIVALNEVGASLNVFDPSSLVSAVNAADSVKVDSHFRKVYGISRDINRASGGMFDPTVSPLVEAWGFGKNHTPTSDTLRIDSLLRMVGIARTSLIGETLVKEHRNITFNFSAIAKGYGVDRVGAMLERNGVSDYMVEIGGEVLLKGKSQRGGDWRISVDSPNGADGNAAHVSQCILSLTDRALATSGNYRNRHADTKGGYGHTISPLTGRPVQTDVASATVVAPECVTADALATACMAVGSQRAMAMCDSLKCPVLLILTDGTTKMSETFKTLEVK